MTTNLSKTQKIVYWVVTGFVTFIFVGSAIGKFMANPESVEMASKFGLNTQSFMALGAIEIAAAILFFIPRTGVVGTLLLAAYMGGAIATHLEHDESVLAPCIVEAIVFSAALFRFPELGSRLFNTKS